MNIRPIKDLIVIRPNDSEELSAGGIHLVPRARKKTDQGTVAHIGQGSFLDNGTMTPITDLKEGDVVIFNNYEAIPSKIGDEEFLFVSYKNIYAVIED